MAPWHPRVYNPTFQQGLAIFYHQIICCPTKCTLIQKIKVGAFVTCPEITANFISKYLLESDFTAKGNLAQQNQRPPTVEAANMTPLATKAGDNTSEVLLQNI